MQLQIQYDMLLTGQASSFDPKKPKYPPPPPINTNCHPHPPIPTYPHRCCCQKPPPCRSPPRTAAAAHQHTLPPPTTTPPLLPIASTYTIATPTYSRQPPSTNYHYCCCRHTCLHRLPPPPPSLSAVAAVVMVMVVVGGGDSFVCVEDPDVWTSIIVPGGSIIVPGGGFLKRVWGRSLPTQTLPVAIPNWTIYSDGKDELQYRVGNKRGAWSVVVMEMEIQLIMLHDFTNGLPREMREESGFNSLPTASSVW
ncbi:P450 reductase 1 [Actinidia rufa]|uniref:P450 reductase 1 n=1 Tax=Actinidia rufa TaxID=165716 RepID=A0A7J0FN00_9ERIC|nr:P450 reductase 1 [Actinidia rufa]